MKIYIEHDKEFYDYSDCNGYSNPEHFINNINRCLFPPCRKTDKRDFEIGARVYFENVGWTEKILLNDGDGLNLGYCVFSQGLNRNCISVCKSQVLCGMGCIFKKFDLSEKQEEPKQTEQFYVLNIKTGATNFIHESEQSAKTEAERLASKQPGDIFRVLKVVGECVGKVNVEWEEK